MTPTHITINSYDLTRFVNLEAEVFFPEDEGIVQVEKFGIGYSVLGSTLYGIRVDAIMDKVSLNLGVDNIARMMVDVAVDSSKITDSILSPRQCDLLSCVFQGYPITRDKVAIYICEEIEPKLKADKARVTHLPFPPNRYSRFQRPHLSSPLCE